jgi:hypothetical protein
VPGAAQPKPNVRKTLDTSTQKANGGRKHENMTLAEEKALLARFAKAASAGEMLNTQLAGPQSD